MKNINYMINGVLAVAVIILFILYFTGSRETTAPGKKTFTAAGDSSGVLPIAYVNLDSLLLNYNYYQDLFEIVMKKEESARLSVNQEANKLQREMQEFQKKVENSAFLTRERAEQERDRLVRKQQELETLNSRLSEELMVEQQKMTEQLRDSLVAQLKIFNQDKKYQVILSNSTAANNILLAEEIYDITDEIIDYLNKNYVPTGSAK
jgi:outer membrane protein